jgi:hypothetical protein
MDPDSVGAALQAKGYDVIWTLEPANHEGRGDNETLSAPPAGTVVTWAWLRGPHTVDVRLMREGPYARHYQRTSGTFLPAVTPPWTPPCP